MIEVYGVARSRAFRCLWALEELGLPYQHHSVDWLTDAKQPEYLKLNPNARVPCLRDGDLVLFESLAINLYLGRRYGLGSLMPTDVQEEARVLQWTLWATNEIEPHLSTVNHHRTNLPEAEREPAIADAAEAKLPVPLKVLDAALAGGGNLLGSSFTLADLNVASVLSTAIVARVDLSPYANISAWFGRAFQRDAAQRTIALFRSGK
jgi:glutathione S-transferase